MDNELEDWQLALLVEARRYDDPVIVESDEAKQLQDAQDFLEQAADVDNPRVVDQSVVDVVERAQDLLEQAEGIDNPVVLEEDDHDALRESEDDMADFLSDALREHHDLRDGVVERMDVPAMIQQFRDEDDGGIELESLAQHPETGGVDEDDLDDTGGDDGGDGGDPDPLADVSSETRSEARDKLETADMMADRTPQYAETLRAEAAELIGVDDADEIDMEAL